MVGVVLAEMFCETILRLRCLADNLFTVTRAEITAVVVLTHLQKARGARLFCAGEFACSVQGFDQR